MRKTLIVANWKMHLTTEQASLLVHRLEERIRIHRSVEVVLAPSFFHLQPLSLQIDRRKFVLASQDGFYKDEGAYTGEVSFAMMQDLVRYAIIGHSERRIYFNESLQIVRDKVAASFRNGIIPILCVGETSEERKAGETRQVLHDQVVSALSNLTSEEVAKMVIAYEPVWAISTFGGEIAKPDDIHSSVSFIRMQVEELYGSATAKQLHVLYGGSVDNHIVGGYLTIDGCDGALVGSASLNYDKFAGIVDVAFRLHESKT